MTKTNQTLFQIILIKTEDGIATCDVLFNTYDKQVAKKAYHRYLYTCKMDSCDMMQTIILNELPLKDIENEFKEDSLILALADNISMYNEVIDNIKSKPIENFDESKLYYLHVRENIEELNDIKRRGMCEFEFDDSFLGLAYSDSIDPHVVMNDDKNHLESGEGKTFSIKIPWQTPCYDMGDGNFIASTFQTYGQIK